MDVLSCSCVTITAADVGRSILPHEGVGDMSYTCTRYVYVIGPIWTSVRNASIDHSEAGNDQGCHVKLEVKKNCEATAPISVA